MNKLTSKVKLFLAQSGCFFVFILGFIYTSSIHVLSLSYLVMADAHYQRSLSIMRQNYYLEYFLHKTAIHKLGYDKRHYYEEADKHFDMKQREKFYATLEQMYEKENKTSWRNIGKFVILPTLTLLAGRGLRGMGRDNISGHASAGLQTTGLTQGFVSVLFLCGWVLLGIVLLVALMLIVGYLANIHKLKYIGLKIVQKVLSRLGIYVQFDKEKVYHTISERKILSYVLPALRVGYLAERKEAVIDGENPQIISQKSNQMERIIRQFDTILQKDQAMFQKDKIFGKMVRFLIVETVVWFGILLLWGRGYLSNLNENVINILLGATLLQVTAMLTIIIKDLYQHNKHIQTIQQQALTTSTPTI